MSPRRSVDISTKSATILGPEPATSPQQSINNFRDTASTTRLKNALFKQTDGYLTSLNCECGVDLYNRVLGPTADEAFLRGLQTVFNVCKKFLVCEKEHEVPIQPKETPTAPKVISAVLESIGLPPEVASQIVQTSFEMLEEEKPSLADKILQTSAIDMISQILQTMGLEPEMVSAVVQTMSMQLDKISMRSKTMQTSPRSSLVSVFAQTSEPQTAISEAVKSNSIVEILSSNSAKESATPEPLEKKSSVSCQCSPEDFNENCRKSSDDKNCSKKSPDVVEGPQMCICCKCLSSQKTLKKSKSRSNSLLENMKTKCEAPSKLRYCRCYDCSTAVVYKVDKKKNEVSGYKPKTACGCQLQQNSSSSTRLFAEGDSCSLMESCCCDK